MAEARVLKAQIAAAEARQELERKKREQESAAAEHASGTDANTIGVDTVKSYAAAAQCCEARLLASAAIARDVARHFREALLSVVNALAQSSRGIVAAGNGSSTSASPGMVLKSMEFVDLLQRYTDENLAVVEELSRPDSEASHEIVALMRAETGE